MLRSIAAYDPNSNATFARFFDLMMPAPYNLGDVAQTLEEVDCKMGRNSRAWRTIFTGTGPTVEESSGVNTEHHSAVACLVERSGGRPGGRSCRWWRQRKRSEGLRRFHSQSGEELSAGAAAGARSTEPRW